MVTGTATLVVFDIAALQHRFNDYVDWWSDPDEELKELNQGNVIFVALGADGRYEVDVATVARSDSDQVSAIICCPTGRLFVGPGEDITGGELQPQTRRTSGRILEVDPGTYRAGVTMTAHTLHVTLMKTDASAVNAFAEGLSVAT